MSRHTNTFDGGALALPYDLESRLAQWDALRGRMVRGVPEEFTRDEWAYLVTFISHESLRSVFVRTFGETASMEPASLFRPRGPIAVWLPNNVSLLGPLVLVLASFTGTPVRVKAGSRSDDLCAAFVRYAVEQLDEGELRTHLQDRMQVERFDRQDPRNAAMAAEAAVRIVFGSDVAVAAVHGLPHPGDSVGISFGDHRSEAWVEMAAMDDAAVATLAKVFAMYGQGGCTSPRRLVVIDGTASDCETLRDRMARAWTSAIRREVPMHVASQNILHAQLNAAAGWDVQLVARNGAVLGVGALHHAEMSGLMSLGIVPGSVDDAISMLPANIQTVGTRLLRPRDLLSKLGATKVKRFVPVGEMHHFGPVWDGQNFFRQLFEEVAVG